MRRPRSSAKLATAAATAMLCASFSLGLGSSPAQANHQPCDQVEQTTFVYRAGSGQTSYGSMANIFAYDRDVALCAAANTTFMRLGLTFDNYVETGLYYRTTSATPFGFLSWRVNGGASGLAITTQQFTLGSYYSFALSPTDASHWKSEFDRSGNQSTWTVLRGSPALATNRGLPESEVSRFHGQNGAGSYAYLKYRPSTGGWLYWDALACDPNAGGIDNWDAVKISNHQWYTRNAAPAAGDC